MENSYPEEMLSYFENAAGQGNPSAYIGLANRYRYGAGVSQDNQKAAEWYQKAAGKGNIEAQKALEKISN